MDDDKLGKVIKALEWCRGEKPSCDGCPYDIKNAKCLFLLHSDALELLKKQEPKSVNDYESGGVYRFVGLKRGTCPSCSHEVIGGNSTKFWWNCGQAVKWE